jgi:thiamine kinase-like enzyme
MKGASGAGLKLTGDIVTKTCKDATEQHNWFCHAESIGTIRGVRLPKTFLETAERYKIEFIEGHEATRDQSLKPLQTCLNQILAWSHCKPQANGAWDGYLTRLEDHVRLANSREIKCAHALLARTTPFPATFCHGDLTLENVLIANSDQQLVVIDPNFKQGLFQSYILDIGKLLQSTHAGYHRVFRSHLGVDLSRHDRWLVSELKRLDLWEQSHLACISHLIRLRKYRPESERHLVDQLIKTLTTSK